MARVNRQERIEMVWAMDTIARSLNDEDMLDLWLRVGVPDHNEDVGYDYYAEFIDDDTLKELMRTFQNLMARDYKSNGGFYCDGIVS